jgi:hypothetical protein
LLLGGVCGVVGGIPLVSHVAGRVWWWRGAFK